MWFLLWTVLVVGGLALLGWLGYRVVRKGLAVLRELEDVSARWADVSDQARVAIQARLAAQAEAAATVTAATGSADRTPLTSPTGLR